MIAAVGDLRPAILIGVYTALRRRNIFGLDWKAHVDLAEGKLSFPAEDMKAGRAHSVPIHPVLRRVLEGLPGRTGLVLGRHIQCCRDALHGACRRAAIPEIGWHTLRRSTATWLSALGVPPATISQVLGHASTSEIDPTFNPVTGLYILPGWSEVVDAIGRLPDLTVDGL